MSLWQAMFLGLIQGLTEFLPVSSSGHLVIFQRLLGLDSDGGVLFEVLVHTGTLVAVLVAFWPDILAIITKPKQKLTWLLFVGIVPAGLLGVFLEDFFAGLYDSVFVVGLALLLTGLLLWYAEHVSKERTDLARMSTWQALFVGIAQGLAIIPGLSRSGATISAALALGMDRESSARYSFLVSIPVIAGAGLLQLRDLIAIGATEIPIVPYIAAMLVSAISGYWAIRFLLKLLAGGHLRVFSFYVWIVGSLVLVSQLI